MFTLAEDGKTAVEENSLVHMEMRSGGLSLFTYQTSFDPDDATDHVVSNWRGEEEVCWEQRFTIPQIVESMIEFRGDVRQKNCTVFSPSDAPMVAELRSQLIAALALVDSISFSAD